MTRRLGAVAATVLLAAVALCACTPAQTEIPAGLPQPRTMRDAPPSGESAAQAYAEQRVATMTLDQKIASLLLIHVAGTSAGPIKSAIAKGGVAGVIEMGDNIAGSVSSLRKVNAALSPDPGLPVLIATDQEGGYVSRLPGDSAPAGSGLRTLPASAAQRAFTSRSKLVRAAGVTVNFGIVADVTADPSSFIYIRSMGGTASDAASRVAAAVAGEDAGGAGRVASTLKHFPGHGAPAGDSHIMIPSTGMSFADWQQKEAPPFQAGIDAGAQLVMVGHLRYTAVDSKPATLSAKWHDILRTQLGFHGVIVTDDMAMLEDSGNPAYANRGKNAVAALVAGNDLLLYVAPVNVKQLVATIDKAVQNGTLSEQAIDDAAVRVVTLRRELSGFTAPYVPCSYQCQP